MRKALAALGLVAAGSFVLPGCYLTRQVTGDDMVGGPVAPAAWVTMPVDLLLFPFEVAHYIDKKDSWVPWSADEARAEYVDDFKFPGE